MSRPLVQLTFPDLSDYLGKLGKGLRELPPGRKRVLLREVESNLLDEAEARGIDDEKGMQALLSEKDPPEVLAARIKSDEREDFKLKAKASLAAGIVIAVLSGGYLMGVHLWPLKRVLFFGFAYGFIVGSGIFLLRDFWKELDSRWRLTLSITFGVVLGIPLAFTGHWFFVLSRITYGAFAGYLFERYSSYRGPFWLPVVETLVFTLLDRLVIWTLYPFSHPIGWIPELAFNFTITFTLLTALKVRLGLLKWWSLDQVRNAT